MPHPSDHDLIAEKIRNEERQKLIDHYIEQAAIASEEYGFLNVRGHEVPDPTVMEPPLGYIKQPDMMELMRRMIRGTLSQAADELHVETFEEADDFEVDDDPIDYSSPYELYFDPSPGAPSGPPGDATNTSPNDSPSPPPGAPEPPIGGDPPAAPPSQIKPPQGGR